jgi:glycosyltransferase involved in cell wall biosynthesis
MSVRAHDVVIPLLGFNPSGGVRMVIHVANELAGRGVRVAFGTPERASAPPAPLRDGVDVIVRRGARSGRAGFVAGLPPARLYVATGWQTPLLIAAGMAAHGRRRPIVYLVQGDERDSHIAHGSQPAIVKPLLKAIASAGLHVPATRIAVSRYVAGRVGSSRIHRVIAPGIGPEFIEIAGRGAPRPGHVPVRVGVLPQPGRVKGLSVAVNALRATTPGGGGLQRAAFDGANPAPLPDFMEPFSRVAAASGLRHDITDFYQWCDIFIFPSLVEGFGLPPLEAMACGAAVITSDCGGVREYAEHDRNCLLVPPGCVDALVTAIVRLAGEASLRARLGAAGRETALRFPVERFAAQCADEIQRVLAAGNPG